MGRRAAQDIQHEHPCSESAGTANDIPATQSARRRVQGQAAGAPLSYSATGRSLVAAGGGAGSSCRKTGASLRASSWRWEARSSGEGAAPVEYHPTRSRAGKVCLSARRNGGASRVARGWRAGGAGGGGQRGAGRGGSHWSSFLARKAASRRAGSPGTMLTSNELLMSTVRPACWPSRQPATRIGGAPGAALALDRVWWSLMLISTSCAAGTTARGGTEAGRGREAAGGGRGRRRSRTGWS